MVAPTPIKPVAPALPSLGKAHTHQTNHEDRDGGQDQAKLPAQRPGCGEPQVQVQQGADPADHQ